MPDPVKINIWEVLTSIEGRELPQSGKAKAIVTKASQRASFGSELTFEVDDMGNWIIEIFDHECSDSQSVKLRVGRHGDVSVKRKRGNMDTHDTREVRF